MNKESENMEKNETGAGRAGNAGAQRRWIDNGYVVLAIIVGILALPLSSLGVVVWYTSSRLLEGELVLTRTGCQALEYHGASVEYLDEGAICAIHTKFSIAMREGSGRVLVENEYGAFEVELSGKEVVSKSYR